MILLSDNRVQCPSELLDPSGGNQCFLTLLLACHRLNYLPQEVYIYVQKIIVFPKFKLTNNPVTTELATQKFSYNFLNFLNKPKTKC